MKKYSFEVPGQVNAEERCFKDLTFLALFREDEKHQHCFGDDQFCFSLGQRFSELKNFALIRAEHRCLRENPL